MSHTEPGEFEIQDSRLSGEFDSSKDFQSTSFDRRPQIFVKLTFTELCDSKLTGLHAFDSMGIIL